IDEFHHSPEYRQKHHLDLEDDQDRKSHENKIKALNLLVASILTDETSLFELVIASETDFVTSVFVSETGFVRNEASYVHPHF
ncbi:hypothetical protein HAX54_037861, partial [Datura stramonium]|nr:hypothetical protein [Datura stramonium]